VNPVTGFVVGIDGGVPGSFQLGFIAAAAADHPVFFTGLIQLHNQTFPLTDFAGLDGFFHNDLPIDFLFVLRFRIARL